MKEEVPVSLTTPVPRDFDAVFPGENWFLYWKTSASLWQAKLQEYTESNRIVVPINWAFHTETGDTYNFAQERPETDLKKLIEAARAVGKEITFIIPITPAPFLPNGGLPSFLARTLSLGPNGMVYGSLDGEGSLNKIYSFFDTRVYQAFCKFTASLGEYFTEAGVDSDIWGASFGLINNGEFSDFFIDRSRVFEQGFSRFLTAKKQEEAGNDIVSDVVDEDVQKLEFHNTIKDLYLQEAMESLSGNWEGSLNFGFLGASTDAFFNRLSGNDDSLTYSRQVMESMVRDVVPSSILIPHRSKKGVLGKQLTDLIANSFLEAKLRQDYYDDDSHITLVPLRFFDVYDYDPQVPHEHASWESLGLLHYFSRNYRWCFSHKTETTIPFDENSNHDERIHFFHGERMNRKSFNTLLKIFMSGGKVMLNRSGLSIEYLKRLESFFLENSLKVEKVNFHTIIHNIVLGEGRLIILEGDKLTALEAGVKLSFWKKLLDTFGMKHLPIKTTEGVDYFWRTRTSSPSELNYEEIRRVSFYNPTSYKQKIQIKMAKNFALMKVLDENNVHIQSSPNEQNIEMLPGGVISMDFGVYS